MVHTEALHAVYVKLDNRPGTLEHAARTLGRDRLNIDGISLETQGGQGYGRLLTKHPRDVVHVLRNAGVEAYETELLLTALPNHPGELARACAELAAAGLNVEAVLTTRDGKLALRTSDNEQAARILTKL